MISYPPRRDACSYVSCCVQRFACIAAALAIAFSTEENAMAQNRDPQAVFEYAEQREETGVDTHFGPTAIDRIFDPFKCFDAKMEAVGGPQILGLYAPIWQTGTQAGVSDLLSQSLNMQRTV